MPIPAVTVYGTFYHPDESLASFADVRFVLSDIGVYVEDILLPKIVATKCDINGYFSLSLSPSPVATHYTCVVSVGNTQIFDEIVVVPESDCNLSMIIQSQPPPLSAADTAMRGLQTLLSQAEVIRQEILASQSSLLGLTAVAGEPLGGHKAIILGASELAYYADCNEPSHLGRLYGITTNAAAQGAVVAVVRNGCVVEPSWAWVADQPVYLGEQGFLTQTVPATGFQHVVGVALSATELLVNPREPILIIN